MSFILSLDQGTSSSRAIIFDHDVGIRAVAQKEFRQIFPQSGWVEHDPREIWSTQLKVARQALATAGLNGGDINAIGITNQRETTVIWDRRTGEPIHNAIVWQDRRTAKFCDELKRAGHGELITRKTGLVVDAYFSGSKIRWLLDHVPGARERAHRGELAFGTIDTWLLWNLTGGNRHDSTQLIPLVDRVPPVRGKVGRPRRRPDRICADRGYDYEDRRSELRRRGITPEIARRKTEHGSGLGRYRWVVERTFAWLHQFKRLLVRYDRRADIHEAFLAIGCCIVCYRRLRNTSL
jgi:transposase